MELTQAAKAAISFKRQICNHFFNTPNKRAIAALGAIQKFAAFLQLKKNIPKRRFNNYHIYPSLVPHCQAGNNYEQNHFQNRNYIYGTSKHPRKPNHHDNPKLYA